MQWSNIFRTLDLPLASHLRKETYFIPGSL
jgi:hypothetical protein